MYYFLVQCIVAMAWPVAFSLRRNFISDLGNTICGIQHGKYICSPLHGLMNFSFIVIGLALVFGALIMYHSLASSNMTKRAFALIGIAGLGTTGIGFLPENLAPTPHITIAIICLVSLNFGVATFYWLPNLPKQWRLYAITSAACGLVALAMLTLNLPSPLGLGGIERVADYVPDIWIFSFGVYCWLRPNPRLFASFNILPKP